VAGLELVGNCTSNLGAGGRKEKKGRKLKGEDNRLGGGVSLRLNGCDALSSLAFHPVSLCFQVGIRMIVIRTGAFSWRQLQVITIGMVTIRLLLFLHICYVQCVWASTNLPKRTVNRTGAK
jgi:hypothetical protein